MTRLLALTALTATFLAGCVSNDPVPGPDGDAEGPAQELATPSDGIQSGNNDV